MKNQKAGRILKVKLVVTDLDDTLLRDDRTISERSRRTISRAVERGIHVAIATGRLGEDPDVARARITQALEQCAGNQTRAAQLLGVSRRTLINHLERLNMPRPKKV